MPLRLGSTVPGRGEGSRRSQPELGACPRTAQFTRGKTPGQDAEHSKIGGEGRIVDPSGQVILMVAMPLVKLVLLVDRRYYTKCLRRRT